MRFKVGDKVRDRRELTEYIGTIKFVVSNRNGYIIDWWFIHKGTILESTQTWRDSDLVPALFTEKCPEYLRDLK